MAELKTRPTRKSVTKYLNQVEHPVRQQDAFVLLEILEQLTGKKAVLWGDSIVGFGKYQYNNSQGSYEWPTIGFSPRKQNLTVYIMPGFNDYQHHLDKLGKAKTARSCLYINKLADVDLDELKALCQSALTTMNQRYQCR